MAAGGSRRRRRRHRGAASPASSEDEDDDLEPIGEVEDGLLTGAVLPQRFQPKLSNHTIAYKPRAADGPSKAQMCAAFNRLPTQRFIALPAVTSATATADSYPLLTPIVLRAADQAIRLGRQALLPISIVPGSWAALALELNSAGTLAVQLYSSPPLALENYTLAQDLVRHVGIRIPTMLPFGVEVCTEPKHQPTRKKTNYTYFLHCMEKVRRYFHECAAPSPADGTPDRYSISLIAHMKGETIAHLCM